MSVSISGGQEGSFVPGTPAHHLMMREVNKLPRQMAEVRTNFPREAVTPAMTTNAIRFGQGQQRVIQHMDKIMKEGYTGTQFTPELVLSIEEFLVMQPDQLVLASIEGVLVSEGSRSVLLYIIENILKS